MQIFDDEFFLQKNLLHEPQSRLFTTLSDAGYEDIISQLFYYQFYALFFSHSFLGFNQILGTPDQIDAGPNFDSISSNDGC